MTEKSVGNIRLRESVFVPLLHVAQARVRVCVVLMRLCSGACVQDELRQRERRNAAVTSACIAVQEM